MDKKLTVQQFASAISEQCGVKYELALEVVRCIFESVSDRLAEAGEAEVSSLGSFRVVKGDDVMVEFTPTNLLAEEINSPFQAFEALEVSEDFDNTMAETDRQEPSETQALPEQDEQVQTEKQLATDAAEATVEEEISEAMEQFDTDDAPVTLNEDDVTDDLTVIPAIPAVPDSVDAVSSDMEQPTPPPFDPNKAYGMPCGGYSIPEDEEIFATNDDSRSHKHKFNFIYGIITGVVIAAGLAALGFFVYEVLL